MTSWVFWSAIGLPTAVALWVCRRSAWAAWWSRLREARRRILAEDALKHIHDCKWQGHAATLDSLSGHLQCSPRKTVDVAAGMEAWGWVRSTADALTLTPAGERLALQVIRAHRLWERYLADEARMDLADLHGEAERREHMHTPDTLDALEAAMGHPAVDPHGDPIPTSEGELARLDAEPLTDWPTDTPGRIVHIEDEPATIFRKIVAMGFRPGMIVQVLEASADRVVLSDGRQTHVTIPVVAANVFVAPVPADEIELHVVRRLTALRRGETATVQGLDEELRGYTRRRLLDLGITRGATITAELASLSRDPTAYRVRGALIALRKDQAKHVLIGPNGNGHGT